MSNEAPAVLVLSHGPFCQGLVETVRMVYGDAQRLEALPLMEGDNPEEYVQKIEALIDKYDGNVFICVDLFGGTPFNSIMMLAQTRKLYAIAGINVPILIELLVAREDANGSELATRVLEAASAIDSNMCDMLAAMNEP